MKYNFFPIKFEFDEFDIQRIPYKEGLLPDLRKQYNSTHSFFRRGDFIYISPGTADAVNLGTTVRLSIQENQDVVSRLIKHVFFRTVKEAQPTLQPQFYPFTFAALDAKFDLARPHVPEHLRGVLTYKRLTEVEFRDHTDTSGRVSFGTLINHRYRWNLSRRGDELHQEDFDLAGREVIGYEAPEYSDGVVAPEMSLLGRVYQVIADRAQVDTSNGRVEYPLTELYLHHSRDNITAYLAKWVGEGRASAVMHSIKMAEAERLKPQGIMQEVEKMASWLSRLVYRNHDAFGFHITQNNVVNPATAFSLPEPNLLFDLNRTRVHRSPSTGLNLYGPYSRSTGFDVNAPRMLVIFHRQNEGLFTRFLAQLIDGVPNHSYFANGLARKYVLTSLNYRIVELTDYTVAEYLAAINLGIQQEGTPFDLALVETCDEFRRLPPAQNPYYQVKAALLAQGTAVQFVKAATIQDPTYKIDGIALQLYAKLGGTPWAIPSDPNVDRELVVGIGSTIQRQNLYAGAAQTRYVGISTFFTADGLYQSNSRTQHVPYEEYFGELLRSLKESLDLIANQYSWAEGSRVRLIFHIFKPIRNVEAEVVAELMRRYPQYDIRFAFVTISERHPYLLYDENQRGDRAGRGANIPARGYCLPLGPRACLVHLLGTGQVRVAKHGAPHPVLVRIHEHSTFHDLRYVVEQVFKFSRLSFRTFEPSYSPVTLLYANLLTRQLRELREVPHWNYTVANAQLRKKKWFL